MKALVVSGGGARGAWGGGLAHGLFDHERKDYDLYVGTSTGALLVPLIASHEFRKLKIAYTNVSQDSIFKRNPFKSNGKLKVWNIFWTFITKKESFGDSSNLRKLLDQFFEQEMYDKLIESNKEVHVCVTNLNQKKTEYFSVRDCAYEDFKDWMYASACAPVYMSIINKNGQKWSDGGIVDNIPIQHAIDEGATEIDVIVHRQESIIEPEWKGGNIIQTFVRVNDILATTVHRDDINLGMLQAKVENVKLNIYYMNRRWVDNVLLFDKEIMLDMWKHGYNQANPKEETVHVTKKSYMISSNPLDNKELL